MGFIDDMSDSTATITDAIAVVNKCSSVINIFTQKLTQHDSSDISGKSVGKGQSLSANVHLAYTQLHRARSV